MKETKNLLCKKRKKIFRINKCEKGNYKNPTKNSLIGISKLVLDYVKENEHKTGNQITEYVINALQPENDDKIIQKNIQRRVYDSINVLNALGLIQKNKQNINYVHILNKNENNKISNIKEKKINEINEKNNEEINLKNIEYIEKLKELKLLQKELIKKYITLKCFEQVSKISNNEDKNTNVFLDDKNLNNNNNNYYSENKSRNIKNSLLINNSNEIIKKKIAQEILTKLDVNINKKKIKKEEKSSNIFKIKKNNKNEENQNYLIISKNQKLNGNINEKKNEDIVFNYLKKLKIFQKELFSFT
jgi:hypothetical protein